MKKAIVALAGCQADHLLLGDSAELLPADKDETAAIDYIEEAHPELDAKARDFQRSEVLESARALIDRYRETTVRLARTLPLVSRK